MKQDNLTAKQLDANGRSQYAIFLPALSGFYGTYIGKQRGGPYVPQTRMPTNIQDMEQLNWLNAQKGLFTYKWSLYSAGHANLDLTKQDWNEDMVRNRDRANTFILGDSGGFQIGKGVWEGEWRDPNGPEVKAKMAEAVARGIESVPVLKPDGTPKHDKNGNIKYTAVNHVKVYQAKLDAAQKKREAVLAWMDGIMDYGMVLDIPEWVERSPAGRKATGIESYQQAVEATKYNNEYFIANRNGNCKFLNVLQGENHAQAEDWYQQMKDFCDPNIYGNKAFNGWAMGGQNMCDVDLVLRRLVALKFDGLLQEGKQDWMHFLGTSKLEWALLLTDIQRAIRKYVNPNFTISFDCASPFLATANGQVYHQIDIKDREKWCYRMSAIADDKKYSADNRSYRDAVLQDGLIHHFDESPVSANLQIKDVCYYAPGMLNKIGKEGKTSWDSFSYALLMAHNVWLHLESVQRANREYDAGKCPGMLVDERFDTLYFKDVVEAIFAAPDRETAIAIIDMYDKLWQSIIGTRGATGKKTVNASTMYNNLFEAEEPEEHPVDDSGLDESKLDELEA
jgi:hypothetical protein